MRLHEMDPESIMIAREESALEFKRLAFAACMLTPGEHTALMAVAQAVTQADAALALGLSTAAMSARLVSARRKLADGMECPETIFKHLAENPRAAVTGRGW